MDCDEARSSSVALGAASCSSGFLQCRHDRSMAAATKESNQVIVSWTNAEPRRFEGEEK